jgi:hypothetical protein
MKIKYTVFKEIVAKLKEQSETLNKVYASGVDLTNIVDSYEVVISHLIGTIYGKEGKETFDWWCYEKEWGSRTDITMWDADDNPVCETIEDLYEWLESGSDSDYDLPIKLTDSQKMEMLNNLFDKNLE